ncbi:MAG: hypothetical protein Q8S13_01125 [Dehalococcoidia bacterium]|nr:hypothetical protein [Dehalococcoidia bacterium]
MTAALAHLGTVLGFDIGAKEKEAPSAEELKAKLQKVLAARKKIAAQLKAAKSKSQKQAYAKQFKALKRRAGKLKQLLKQHKSDAPASESEESEESEDLSGPIMERVGGFVAHRPVISLLLAALAGAAISRRMQ